MPKGVYERKPRLSPIGPTEISPGTGAAARRARIAALTGHCISGSTNEDWEATVAWVESASCEVERDVRMLCLELVASHLRAMSMDSARLLKVLQRLADFALPDSPATAGPGATPRRSAGSA